MPIEGPLRELGIHDVFQLLDLSRKTGLLRVSAALSDDEGLVYFDNGRVIQASIANGGTEPNTPKTRASMAVASSKRERDRQLRTQIEAAVFELMSWREGFFSFEERAGAEMPDDAQVSIATASLLMEGARRIDEWSRIAKVVSGVGAIPDLAAVDADRDGPMLDLLPHEWQVLTMIDGRRDIRTIAAELTRDEFEIAKVIYGLATTAIITLRSPSRVTASTDGGAVQSRLAAAHLEAGITATRLGDFATARASFEQTLRLACADSTTTRAQAALDAIAQLERALEAHVSA